MILLLLLLMLAHLQVHLPLLLRHIRAHSTLHPDPCTHHTWLQPLHMRPALSHRLRLNASYALLERTSEALHVPKLVWAKARHA